MPFVPMVPYKGSGVRCSVTPVDSKSGGGWYCLTCDKQFGDRGSPPCGEDALPNPKHDNPDIETVENPLRTFR